MTEEGTTKQQDEMYCSNCGALIKKDVRFCPQCGGATGALQPAAAAAQPAEARRAARVSSLALALPTIESDVRRRVDTDRQMSFWGNLLATFALAAVTFFVFFLGGLIWSLIFHYRLVERQNQHYARQRSLYGRIVDALRQHGQEANNNELVATAHRAQALLDEGAAAERRRNPWLWGVIFGFIITWLPGYWVVMSDLQKHSGRQTELSETIVEGLRLATGAPVSIVDQSTVPERNVWLYLVVGILTLPLLAIGLFVWVYRIFDDANKHFARQAEFEDQIISHLGMLASQP